MTLSFPFIIFYFKNLIERNLYMWTYVEIELDGVITTKRLKLPENLLSKSISNSVTRIEYIRKYFTDMGYTVGNHIRIL